MKELTPSEKFSLLFLSTFLLVGMGYSYHRWIHPPFSHQRLAAQEAALHEAAFEMARQVSLREGGEEDFIRLPHVGPTLARRIVAYREKEGFYRKKDLLNVKGIGAKTYEAIENYLLFE